jgi:hypothetical protein
MAEGESSEQVPADKAEWQRRRRLSEVFGDVLPETTRDERDPDVTAEGDGHDGWLRRQVPPHHG